MWGSDFGNTPGTYHELVQRAIGSAGLLSASERRAVFRDTARAVFFRGRSA
jgi:hypothetical protein